VLLVFGKIHGEIRRKEREQRNAIAYAEYARLRAIRQACRERWVGKSRIPVKGGGWVDMRKIPYDFLSMHQDEDGECRARGVSGDYYYDWKENKFIPQHPAFSGKYRPIESRGMNEGSQGYTFIQYYPKESWKFFRMSLRFYDHEQISECEARGSSYTFGRNGECSEKCKEDDGTYIVDTLGKCVTNTRLKEPPVSPSELVPSATHPDLELTPWGCFPTCIPTANAAFFRIKNWPHEPLPPLIVHCGIDICAGFSREQLGKIDFKDKGFSMNPYGNEGMIVSGGRIYYSRGKIKINEAPVFLRDLHFYASQIFIKEN